jgi:hypothetical protein
MTRSLLLRPVRRCISPAISTCRLTEATRSRFLPPGTPRLPSMDVSSPAVPKSERWSAAHLATPRRRPSGAWSCIRACTASSSPLSARPGQARSYSSGRVQESCAPIYRTQPLNTPQLPHNRSETHPEIASRDGVKISFRWFADAQTRRKGLVARLQRGKGLGCRRERNDADPPFTPHIGLRLDDGRRSLQLAVL